jgi:hypothetical protein
MFKGNRFFTVVVALVLSGLGGGAVYADDVAGPVSARAHGVYVPPAPAPVVPLTLAVVGDSISDPKPGATTWPTFMQAGPVVVNLDDGWARGGTKLTDQAANIAPIHSDVLVVMSGTNDFGSERWATPIGERLASLDLIVVKSGATRVIISAVAPLQNAGWETEWNTVLQAFAAERGWVFFDPWTSLRSADGQDWSDLSLTVDGIHPVAAASEVVAAAFRELLS